jgi:hypothetical protein
VSADSQSGHAFPWREEESLTGRGRVLRPTVDVELQSGELGTTTKALIDTGSPRCVFPRGIGDLLAVDFPKYPSGATESVTLLGQRWPAVASEVDMMLRPFTDSGWTAEVLFVVDDGLPLSLLGCEGFLNRWAVSFNSYLGYFTVESVDDFHSRQPPWILAALEGLVGT